MGGISLPGRGGWEEDTMEEMILAYPNVMLLYADRFARGGTCFGCLKEIEKGEYGYRLAEGQTLSAIRYHGSNKEHYVSPRVLLIASNGIWIRHLMLRYWQAPVFVPWKKSLPNGGIYEMRNMYIEPCEHLFDKYKMADLLAEQVDRVSYLPNGTTDKGRGEGIWYQHGGWRCSSHLDDNLNNFTKMGQQEVLL